MRAWVRDLGASVARVFRRSPKPPVSAVVAIAAAIFTGLQWWEAHSSSATTEAQARAAEDLAKAAREQVAVASRSLEVSRSLVAASRAQAEAQQSQATTSKLLVAIQQQLADAQTDLAKTTESVQLPRLALERLAIVGIGDPPSGPNKMPGSSLSWTYRNVGGSAIRVLDDGFLLFVQEAAPAHLNWKEATPMAARNVQTGPGGTYGITSDARFQLSPEQTELVKAGKQSLYFADRIEYADTRDRRHTICVLAKARLSGLVMSGFDLVSDAKMRC